MIYMKTEKYKALLFGLIFGLLFVSQGAFAGNTPCSGKKGGIARCQGTVFVCNDGSTSASKKDCSITFGGSASNSSSTSPSVNAPKGLQNSTSSKSNPSTGK